MEKHYIKIEGSGDYGLGNHTDAYMMISKREDGQWQELIISDEDGLLECISGSPTYMGYLSIKEIMSYIRKDSNGKFYSVQEVSEDEVQDFI